MTRITAEHLSREACIYFHQSAPCQERHNRESRGSQAPSPASDECSCKTEFWTTPLS